MTYWKMLFSHLVAYHLGAVVAWAVNDNLGAFMAAGGVAGAVFGMLSSYWAELIDRHA